MKCPSCGAEDQESWRYCEACGTALHDGGVAVPVSSLTAPAPAATGISTGAAILACRCGAGPEMRDDLGFCTVCGLMFASLRPAPNPNDHRETVLAPFFAAVTDRGHRHPTNQDNVTLAMETFGGDPAYIMVVCDGLSSSCAAEAASETAVNTVCEALLKAVRLGTSDLSAAMTAAIAEAHADVCEIPLTPDPNKDGPATTLVAAVVHSGTATLGWVGDSRAYTIEHDRADLLTHDHSWANEVVDAGEMTMEEAMTAPEAHVITQCLGPMLDDDGRPAQAPEPSILVAKLPQNGCLILCSDGLWNFAEAPDQMAAQLHKLDAANDALAVSTGLVQFANRCGGRDNITVAALCLGTPNSKTQGNLESTDAV